MVESVLRKVGACAALVLCTAVATHALRELGGALPNASYDDALRARQQAYPALLYPGVVEIGTVLAGDDDEVDKEEYMMDAHPSRNLLHGCHGGRCIPKLPFCPVCRFPNGGRSGHCKKGGLLRTCARRNAAATPSRFVVSQGLGSIGPAECPSIHAQATPGSFDLPQEFAYYDDGDYDEEEVPEDNVFDAFPFEEPDPSIPRTTLFASVSTPEEFQTALREGVIHIVVTQHLDMVDSETEPDLQPPIEALNNAVGRLSNTTLSIVGKCDGPPPNSFTLTEPMPPGACAVRVREDFLDAPSGTTCLLIDSLYVLVAPRGGVDTSSVLILHIDGLMWIANCVFQGNGMNTRAIDTNTEEGESQARGQGTPALYIKDTIITGFRRSLAPGIRVRPSSHLWLDNCVFRDITLTQPGMHLLIQATAIAAESNVQLVLVNTTIENNVVYGEPAGDQAVAITASTEMVSSPRMRVWVWPDGPFAMSDENVAVANSIITAVARPVFQSIQAIAQAVIQRRRFSGQAPQAQSGTSRNRKARTP